MLFTDTTSYSCLEGKYCLHSKELVMGAEDKLIKLCENDPECVAYDYIAEFSKGRLCTGLTADTYHKSKMCKKGTQCISK